MCIENCQERQYSKRAFLKAIREGDLLPGGYCVTCGSLLRSTKQVVPVRNTILSVRDEAPKVPIVAGSSILRKQRCALVVPIPPMIELVYPPLVEEEEERPRGRAAPMRKIVAHGEPQEVAVELAPKWLIPQEPKVVVEVPKTLTQSEQFAALKKRLTNEGRLKMKTAVKVFRIRRARARKQESAEIAQMLAFGAEVIEKMRLLKRKAVLKQLDCGVVLTSSQAVFVKAAVKRDRDASLSMELAVKAMKACKRRQKICPHYVGKEKRKVASEVTVPWGHLGVTASTYCRPANFAGKMLGEHSVAPLVFTVQGGFPNPLRTAQSLRETGKSVMHKMYNAILWGTQNVSSYLATWLKLRRKFTAQKAKKEGIKVCLVDTTTNVLDSTVQTILRKEVPNEGVPVPPISAGQEAVEVQVSSIENVKQNNVFILEKVEINPIVKIEEIGITKEKEEVLFSVQKVVLDATLPSGTSVHPDSSSDGILLTDTENVKEHNEAVLEEIEINPIIEIEEIGIIKEEDFFFSDQKKILDSTLLPRTHGHPDSPSDGISKLTSVDCAKLLCYKSFGLSTERKIAICFPSPYHVVARKCTPTSFKHMAPQRYSVANNMGKKVWRNLRPALIREICDMLYWQDAMDGWYAPKTIRIAEPTTIRERIFSAILRRPTFDTFVDASSMPLSLTIQSDYGTNRRQEEIAMDLEDRASNHNAAMGIRSMPEIVKELRERKTSVAGSSENRLAAENVELRLGDVFRQQPIVQRWTGGLFQSSKDRMHKATPVEEIVGASYELCLPKPGEFYYAPLPVLSAAKIRHYAESGYSHSSVIALDIHMESLIPQGTPIKAAVVLCDGQSNDMAYASLAGGFYNLGEERTKILSLPLAKFSMNDALRDIEAYLTGLYLAFTVSDLCGSRVGRPAAKYTVIGFSEQKVTALSSVTTVKDSFDGILKRQKRQESSRIVAAFNMDQVFSQSLYQEPTEFPDIVYKARPHPLDGQLVIKNGKFEIRDSDAKTLRQPPRSSLSSSSGRNLPWSSRVERPFQERNSEDVIKPRMSYSVQGNVTPSWDLMTQFSVAKESVGGTIVARIGLRDMLRASQSVFVADWKKDIERNVKISGRISMGSSQVAGTALALVCDVFNRTKKTTMLPAALGNQLPQVVFPMCNPLLRSFEFSMNELLGTPVHASVDAYADITFLLYIVNTNKAPCNCNWIGTIFWKFEQDDTAARVVTLPVVPGDAVPLQFWKGPIDWEQDSATSTAIVNLDFATPEVVFDGWRTVTTFNQNVLGSYAGYNGILHGRVVKTGSAQIQADAWVSCEWYANMIPISHKIHYPGTFLEGCEGTFSVEINSPYGATSTHVKQSVLLLSFMAGPVAPDKVTVPFSFMVYFDHIEFKGSLPPIVNHHLEFDWALLTDFAKDEFLLDIPANLPDIITKNAKATMYSNPFALMVASSGLLSGTMALKIKWAIKTAVNFPAGNMWLYATYGKPWPNINQQIASRTSTVSNVTTLSLEAQVAYVGRFTVSGGLDDMCNRFAIYTKNATLLDSIVITVELKPGFEFRGPTITPLIRVVQDAPKEQPHPLAIARASARGAII